MRRMSNMNILCSTDDNYVPYCGIMLTSLFENNISTTFNVYILTEELNTKNKNDLATLANNYQQKIEILTIDKEILKDCPIKNSDYVSLATYYRILAPILLPDNVDTILYLDCDIIINQNIADLYNSNINEYAIGAVIDDDYGNEEKYLRLNIPQKYSYINAGVLLMNLKYWRENNIIDRCLDYIKNNKEKLLQHDQDVINAILHNKTKRLPVTNNFQTAFILSHLQHKYAAEIQNTIREHMYNPTIIHYTGNGKPWHKHSQHPYTNRYLHYYRISIWKEHPIVDNEDFKDKLRLCFAKALWFLGIKKRPQHYILEKQA